MAYPKSTWEATKRGATLGVLVTLISLPSLPMMSSGVSDAILKLTIRGFSYSVGFALSMGGLFPFRRWASSRIRFGVACALVVQPAAIMNVIGERLFASNPIGWWFLCGWTALGLGYGLRFWQPRFFKDPLASPSRQGSS